jgi:competence protein ComGC
MECKQEEEKMLKNQRGFTLIEMMVVLMIISVLLIITVPNVTKNNQSINSKGCEAYVKMVQAQVQAFEMDLNRLPKDITELTTEGYLKKNTKSTCGNREVIVNPDGSVTVSAIATQ